uniref:Band 3 cytoplasmic domain-containing protein n=1 Tax=Romanomermis culicivorax TaxID=13658 RepID=A0A915HRR4_ROMCU
MDDHVTIISLLPLNKIIKNWEEGKLINSDANETVRALLLSNKEHVNSKRHLRLKLHSFSPSSRRVSIDNNSPPTPPNGDLEANGNYEDDKMEESLLCRRVNSYTCFAYPKIQEKTVINVELSKKLPENAEVACVLLGQTECVTSSVSAFVNRKLRFLFVLLAPEEVEDELEMIGRTMGVALTDDIFVHCAYGAENATELCYAVDEIICSALILPPGKWSLENRLEPSDSQKMIT